MYGLFTILFLFIASDYGGSGIIKYLIALIFAFHLLPFYSWTSTPNESKNKKLILFTILSYLALFLILIFPFLSDII